MNLEKYRHGFLFFSLSLLIPWALWFTAAWLSWQPASGLNSAVISFLGLAGLAAPAITASILFLKDAALSTELRTRFTHFRDIKPFFLVACFLLLPGSLLLAQAVSLPFGYGTDQFRLAEAEHFSAGLLPAWFILIIAPILEELAWHSYGMDSLRRKFSLMNATLIFGVYWTLWHLPLGFIQGYYQNEVASNGPLAVVNFVLSLFAYVLLGNYLYFKTRRNIVLAIVFHLSANVGNEMFNTHPDSKIIQTAILVLVCVALLARNKDFFWKKELT